MKPKACQINSYLSVVELPVNVYLSLSDVSRKIWGGMRNIWPNSIKDQEMYDHYSKDVWYASLICNETKSSVIPSLGIVKIGICVMEPFRPSIRPARS